MFVFARVTLIFTLLIFPSLFDVTVILITVLKELDFNVCVIIFKLLFNNDDQVNQAAFRQLIKEMVPIHNGNWGD